MESPSKLSTALLVLGASLCIGCTNPKGIVKFEPGNISTKAVEYSCTFSSDDTEIYFARSEQAWGSGDIKSTIYHAKKKNGKWSTPKVASFSGTHDDSDPHLTIDGNTLYFISNRPSANATRSADIWSVARNEKGAWGTPMILPLSHKF